MKNPDWGRRAVVAMVTPAYWQRLRHRFLFVPDHRLVLALPWSHYLAPVVVTRRVSGPEIRRWRENLRREWELMR